MPVDEWPPYKITLSHELNIKNIRIYYFTICSCYRWCYCCSEGVKAVQDLLGICFSVLRGRCCPDAAGLSSASPVADMNHRYDTVTEDMDMTDI